MNKNAIALVIAVLLFQACAGIKRINVDGTYQGILPCADCPGIDYQLTLKNNQTYSEKTIYQDRHMPAVLDSGTYTIINDTILQLKNEPKRTSMRQLAIRDNQLTVLDMNGQLIHSGYADRYILKKVDPQSMKKQEELAKKLDGRWQLQSINDEFLSEDVQIPWIELNVKQNRFFGFGGCNRLNGEVSFSADSIRFGRIISTKMACINNNVENQFLRIFRNQSWAFDRSDSILTLTNPENKLEFVAENIPVTN